MITKDNKGRVRIDTSRRAALKIAGTAAFAGSLLASGGAKPARAREQTVEVYDDFSKPNGEYSIDDYLDRWISSDLIGFPFEQEALDTRERGFPGELQIEATPFRAKQDDTLDHVKYLAQSTRAFPIPEHGSITFSADIEARTPGVDPERLICPSPGEDFPCKTVLEPQQAAATLNVLNIHETGQLFDWFVGERSAFCLTERLLDPLAPGVDLDLGYTQIVETVDISPGPHNYAIRYSRNPEGSDAVDWFLDGERVASHRKVGVPLDVQNPGRYKDITWRSIDATGELLRDEMTSFFPAHGLFTLLDEYPFSPQYEEYFVSYPDDERIFGQGVNATFDNFVVRTEVLPE
jgi:hypothetical protein